MHPCNLPRFSLIARLTVYVCVSRSFREDNRAVERANRARLMFNVSYGVELGRDGRGGKGWLVSR